VGDGGRRPVVRQRQAWGLCARRSLRPSTCKASVESSRPIVTERSRMTTRSRSGTAHAGAAPARRHRTRIGISQRDLLIRALEHPGLDACEAARSPSFRDRLPQPGGLGRAHLRAPAGRRCRAAAGSARRSPRSGHAAAPTWRVKLRSRLLTALNLLPSTKRPIQFPSSRRRNSPISRVLTQPGSIAVAVRPNLRSERSYGKSMP
jgi:hypothetical protein